MKEYPMYDHEHRPLVCHALGEPGEPASDEEVAKITEALMRPVPPFQIERCLARIRDDGCTVKWLPFYAHFEIRDREGNLVAEIYHREPLQIQKCE